jgi:hypothetical protein
MFRGSRWSPIAADPSVVTQDSLIKVSFDWCSPVTGMRMA